MPTPTGLPKVGERVKFHGYDGSLNVVGTVLERTSGDGWSLRVRWDVAVAGRASLLVDCDWLMKQGFLVAEVGQ